VEVNMTSFKALFVFQSEETEKKIMEITRHDGTFALRFKPDTSIKRSNIPITSNPVVADNMSFHFAWLLSNGYQSQASEERSH
jgi:hypothetical protein